MSHGFLLHSRPFRESSVIAAFITDADGRIDLIVRSVRGKPSKKNNPILPFCRYELSWVGRGELKNLNSFEAVAAPVELQGSRLFCGLYLNELLYYLLSMLEADPALMQIYADSIVQLSVQESPEPTLRVFEMVLLEKLGYGIDFFHDVSGAILDSESYYRFVPEQGLVSVAVAEATAVNIGKGRDFFAIGARDFSTVTVRQLAKSTMRSALAVCLGGKKLRSRELFL
jgi:DNA repair protein RecO (recombination protein O)